MHAFSGSLAAREKAYNVGLANQMHPPLTTRNRDERILVAMATKLRVGLAVVPVLAMSVSNYGN